MKRILFSIIFIIVMLISCMIQLSLTRPDRGQAMGMPFIITVAFSLILLAIYVLLIISDYQLKNKWLRLLVLLSQTGVIVFTVCKAVYYYNFRHNWDKEKYEVMDGLYPPGDENFWVIGFYSLLILVYFIYSYIKGSTYEKPE